MKAQKLRSADVAWLRMDSETNPMTVVGLLALRDDLSLDALKALLRERLLVYDRFVQRIEDQGRPRWIPHPGFDLDAHVHIAEIPGSGDGSGLRGFIGRLMSVPLDLSRPPWDTHLVRDYLGGAAIVMRVHHAVADGIALVQVLLSITDEYAAAPGPGLNGEVAINPGNESLRPSESRLRRIGEEAVNLARQGGKLIAAAARIAFLPTDTPTRFKQAATPDKRIAWAAPIPLDDVKALGSATGATVNDVILDLVCGGLRRYLLAHGARTGGVELGCVVPVNLRPTDQPVELGNEFGIVFLSLPVGIEDADERLAEVQRRMDRLKGSAEPVVALGILRAIGRGPRLLHRTVVGILSSKCSAVVTNVAGPSEQLHLFGNPLSELMFWVPRAGDVGLGISIVSYHGRIIVGVATDAGMAADPEAIIEGMRAEFDELIAARTFAA